MHVVHWPAAFEIDAVFTGYQGPVTHAVPVGDARVVTASFDGHVRVWDAASGDELGQLDAGEPLLRVAVHGTRGVFVTASGKVAPFALADDGSIAADGDAVASNGADALMFGDKAVVLATPPADATEAESKRAKA